MNDLALSTQDPNRPTSSIITEDFGESLDRIGLKIRSLQNELMACASKSKKGPKSYKENPKPKISVKEKSDIHSKENREQYLSTSSKKTQRTPRPYQKSLEATYRSGLETTSDITESFGPLETLENDDEVIISQELKEKLRIIFEKYSRINDKGLPFQLRLSKYRRMMTDSGLVDSISVEDLEVLFLGHNQHKAVIEFEAFLTLLPKIACARYPLSSYTANQGLHLLLTRYILPLNSQIGSVSDFYCESGASTMRDEPFEEGVLIVLKSVYTTLMKIYKEFFSWEVKGIDNPPLLAQNSENGFWNFLKEFEICPGMIPKATGQSLWAQREKSRGVFSTLKAGNELHDWFKKKDAGVVYKFTKFCEFMVSLSFIVYKSHCEIGQPQLNEAEQVAALLGKLQYTKGMAKYALKGSLIVPKETLEKVVSKQNASKESLWLCSTNDQALGKGKFQNSFNEERDRVIENLTQRNKIAAEAHNKTVNQKAI